MTRTRIATIAALLCLWSTGAMRAQGTPEAATPASPAGGPTPCLLRWNVICDQFDRIKQKWISAFENLSYYQWADLLINVFTTQGIHPTIGNVVPASGIAGGAALNWLQGATGISLEGRRSVNGFWAVGADAAWHLHLSGSPPQYTTATLGATHYDLPTLPYFGLAPTSQETKRAFYSLRTTAAHANVTVPLTLEAPRAVITSEFTLGVLYARPGRGPTPSVDTVLGSGGLPTLGIQVTYGIVGAQVRAEVPPREEDPTGLSRHYTSDAALSATWYAALTSDQRSFPQFGLSWLQSYTPSQRVGTVAANVWFLGGDTHGQQDIPFYLQPSIGGTNIGQRLLLPGYQDYRFQAASVAAVHAEYSHFLVPSWVDLVAFYDLGRAGGTLRSLGHGPTYQTVGAALRLQLITPAPILVYYGHTRAAGGRIGVVVNTNLFSRSGADSRGPFAWFGVGQNAGDRGVF